MIGFWDILIIFVYMAAMGFMGVYCTGKNVSTDEYFVGGRRMPGWVVGMSMVGTLMSSISFLAYPGDSYKTTWIRMFPNLLVPLCVIIVAYLILPFYRKGPMTSAYEYIGKRFGTVTRTYFAGTFVVAQLVRISVVLYLVSILMRELTGWNIVFCVLLSGGLVALYTIIGGFEAVVLTDVVQTFVLAIGAIVCFAVIVYQLPGGIGQIFSVAIEDGKFALADLASDGKLERLSWGFSLREKTGVMLLIIGITNWLVMYSTDQTMVQRYCAASSEKEARKALYVCGFTALPIWSFFMLIGTALYVFFKQFPTPETTQMLTGARDAEGIMPFFIVRYMPVGFKGVVLAAVLAAAMSTLSSGINSISTVGVVDIYKKLCVKGRSDKHYLKVAYVLSVVAGIFMIMGSFLLIKATTKTLQDTLYILTAIIGGGGLGIYFVGFFTNKGNDFAAATGAAASVMYSIWVILANRGFLPEFMSVPFDLYYTAFIGNFITFFVVYLIGCLIKPHSKEAMVNLNVWSVLPSEDK